MSDEFSILRRCRTLASFLVCICVCAGEVSAEEPAATQPTEKRVEFPGVVANVDEQYVDLEAKVCLDTGLLEVAACTPDTREHESLVVVTARPMHVHTALLLIGLKNGNPGMSRRVEGEGDEPARWVDVPPQGDAVEAFLVLTGINGEPLEFAISDFIRPSGGNNAGPAAELGLQQDQAAFPNRFVFAGSRMHVDEAGNRRYAADESGNVISIVTFGDEVLCRPTLSSADNAQLQWEINPELLPKVGAKVILRLRPQAAEFPKPEADQTSADE